MKVLVLVLIITNLVFFMWQYKTGELEQHETSVDLSQEPIMLSVEATQLTPNAPNTQVAQTPVEQGKDKPTSSVANLDKTPLNLASHTAPVEQGKDKPTPSVANLDKTPLNIASQTTPVEQGKDKPTPSVANLDKTPLNLANHTAPIEQGKDKPTSSVANLDKTPLNLASHTTPIEQGKDKPTPSVANLDKTPLNLASHTAPVEQGKDKPTPSVANLDKTPLNLASHTAPIEQGKDKPTPSVANIDKTPLNLASQTTPVELGKDNPKKDSPAPEQTQCYQVGPFDDDSSYQAWRKQLTGLKTTLRPVSTHKQSTVSHLVYYPINGAVSVDLAIQMLQAHGIDEFYRLKDGEYRGNLSLGVFKSETNAINFHAQLLSRGIHAQLKPLYRNESLRYVFVEGPQAIAARSQTFKRTHPALTIKSAKGC